MITETYIGSCSSMTEHFITSRLCTGPIFTPQYLKNNNIDLKLFPVKICMQSKR